ncbi:glutamate 5-kinase [Candidatus Uhrbacteria bacterium]|nr:glutamate 5-kinase [Candidatus Uhrbacteria bacterium]
MSIIVIKVGTNVLMDSKDQLSQDVINCYARQSKQLLGAGYAPLFVSSGAVTIGRTAGLKLTDKKTFAAVGQVRLMEAYRKAFVDEGLDVAQLIVSRPDLHRRGLFDAFQRSLTELTEAGIIPIINENDALTNGEPEAFGENDMLAAVVSIVVRAQYLIYLTDQFGLYTQDPREKNGRRHLVCDTTDVAKEFFEYCSHTVSANSMGGMLTKLKGAQLAIAGGVETFIANGKMCVEIDDLLSCRVPATRFYAKREADKITTHERWMLSCKEKSGVIVVDDGAIEAIKKGNTLLAVGVRKVLGEFEHGEIVEIVDSDRHGIGCGIVTMDSRDLELKLDQGSTNDVDVIHRDHLITY